MDPHDSHGFFRYAEAMKSRIPCMVHAEYVNMAPATFNASGPPITWKLMMWQVWPEDMRQDIMLPIDLEDPMYPTLPQAFRIVAGEYVERISHAV